MALIQHARLPFCRQGYRGRYVEEFSSGTVVLVPDKLLKRRGWFFFQRWILGGLGARPSASEFRDQEPESLLRASQDLAPEPAFSSPKLPTTPEQNLLCLLQPNLPGSKGCTEAHSDSAFRSLLRGLPVRHQVKLQGCGVHGPSSHIRRPRALQGCKGSQISSLS